MEGATSGVTIGRETEMERFDGLLQQVGSRDMGYRADFLWVIGGPGCGKSQLLRECAGRAMRAGWEVLAGQCAEETRTDPYGPFLSMLGLCFDRAGRLINDRSVYSIVDQISLDDVFEAVSDIPGMAAVAFGIKVGMSIFESRKSPKTEDELENRNFEFILQVLEQIGRKREKPLLLVLDDLHLASTTTCALIEYVLARIQDARLLMVATWQAESMEQGLAGVREMSRKLAQPEHTMHLLPLPDDRMRCLLERFGTRPVAEPLASALIEFSRGMPGVLVESLRLVELEGELHLGEAGELEATDSVVQALIAGQLAHVSDDQRALLQCASLIGQHVPLDVLTAPPLCAYLALGERASLSLVVELADRGVLLVWDGEDAVRFASPNVRRYLREQARLPVNRRDHLHIAESWQAARGESRPAQLAVHYLAGREPEKALSFALRSAQELSRSAAYPEAVQSYQLALEALEQMPGGEERADRKYDVLRAMSLAAERAGDWGGALIRLEEALALSDGDAVRQAEIYAGLGWLHFQRGEVQAARQHLDRSAGLYRSLGDVQGGAQVEYYLGVLYGQQKEWQRAVACFERYLEVSQEVGFDEGRASAYTELGNLHRLERKWAQAEAYLRRGIDLAQAEGDYAVLAQGYHYLGSCYALQGKPDSIDVLGRALEIVRERTKQPAQEARIQNTLAEAYVRLSHWPEAEAAFRASAEIKVRLGDKAGLAMTYGGLGRLYYRQWRFDLAVEHLQKDIALLVEEFEANVAWIQQLTNLVGEVWRLEGRLDEAAGRFREALVLADRIPDEGVRAQSRGYTHLLLARLALDRVDLVRAESECALSLDVLTGTWADGEVHRTAARLARARGDLEHARQHLDRALAVAERGEEIDRALTYLEEAYYCRDVDDVPGMRRASEEAARLARRLENVELERRARELVRAGRKV